MPHYTKTWAGMVAKLHSFLTLALDGGEWWGSHIGRYTLEKERPVPSA
jgi:hypothetical protein